MQANITRGVIFEDGSGTFMARVLANGGVPITQAEVTSITGYVYDRSGSDPHNAIATVSVSKSTTVYDALQTDDPRWTEDEQDAQGFNFAHAMPATSFPDPHVYRVVYKFIMVGSTDPLWVVYEPNAIRPAG